MVELAALALSIALAAQQPAIDAASAAPVATEMAGQPADAAADSTTFDGAAEATAATPEAASASTPPMEEVSNPYGLEALWKQGDFIAKGTLMILVFMSMGTWFILLTKLWDQKRLHRQFSQTQQTFWDSKSLEEGLAGLSDKGSAFYLIAEQGIKAARHHKERLGGQIPLADWLFTSLGRPVEKATTELQSGLSFLATVGSSSPFVGLFGTVWGIYHALIAIGVAGQASIDKVAGPVGEALIMTALGLAVAVPAVLAYNWLLRRNKTLIEEIRFFATEVQQYLVSGARLGLAGQQGK